MNNPQHLNSDEIMSDRVFMRKLTTSILVIVLAMCGLTFSAWAMFSEGIPNVTQTVEAAHFTVTHSVADGTKQPVNLKNGGVLAAGKYTVTLTASGNAQNEANRSGYCKILLKGAASVEKALYSKQLKVAGEGADGKQTFKLELKEATTVTFITSWATCTVDNRLTDDATVTYGQEPVLTAASNPAQQETQTSPDETSSELNSAPQSTPGEEGTTSSQEQPEEQPTEPLPEETSSAQTPESEPLQVQE